MVGGIGDAKMRWQSDAALLSWYRMRPRQYHSWYTNTRAGTPCGPVSTTAWYTSTTAGIPYRPFSTTSLAAAVRRTARA
eukprot:1849912-Rhodomonas_salina.1